MRSQEIAYEFILVDDGSTDDTFEKIASLKEDNPYIAVVSHYRNHGKSMALMQGFSTAKAELIITMDADLQDQPEDIPSFLDKIKEGYDIVGGWRQNRKDSFPKRQISKLYNFILKILVGYEFRDINCGFKAFTRSVCDKLELRGDMHRLIPVIALSFGYKFTEIPISHRPRKYGRSKYRLFRHRGLLDIFAFVALHTTQLRPLHIFCEAAFVFLVFAIACLSGWFFLTHIGDLTQSVGLRFLSFGLAGLGVWAAFVATICPFFGFYLETISGYFQDEAWRQTLIKRKLDSQMDSS
jgi:glycosyltransferase involved in cell wall biosynthesis